MADVLIDTDVWIDHLRGERELQAAPGMGYSVITRCELLAGKDADPETVDQLLNPFTEYPIGRIEAKAAGNLRRQHAIRTPDALIAATAMQNGLTLVTRNLRDFRKVSGLRVEPPH